MFEGKLGPLEIMAQQGIPVYICAFWLSKMSLQYGLRCNDSSESHRNNSTSGGSRISRRGGVDLVRGAMDPRGGYVLKILHVKMKESGPVGGARAGRAPPP